MIISVLQRKNGIFFVPNSLLFEFFLFFWKKSSSTLLLFSTEHITCHSDRREETGDKWTKYTQFFRVFFVFLKMKNTLSQFFCSKTAVYQNFGIFWPRTQQGRSFCKSQIFLFHCCAWWKTPTHGGGEPKPFSVALSLP